MIRHYNHSYEPISIMEGQPRVLFQVAQLFFWICLKDVSNDFLVDGFQRSDFVVTSVRRCLMGFGPPLALATVGSTPSRCI